MMSASVINIGNLGNLYSAWFLDGNTSTCFFFHFLFLFYHRGNQHPLPPPLALSLKVLDN